MTTALKKLEITKIALVEEGSCSEAHINLFKSKEGKGTKKMAKKTLEEILKGLSEEDKAVIDAEIATINKAKSDLETEKGELEKACSDMKKEMEDKDDKDDEDDNDEDKLMKSASPEIQAIVKAAREQAKANALVAQKLQDEKMEVLAKSKAATLKNLSADEANIAGIFKSLNGTSSEMATKVFEILERANAVIEKSKAFEEAGTGTEGATSGDSDSAWSEIEKAAEPISKAKNITKEQAITEVMINQPELYKKYTDSL